MKYLFITILISISTISSISSQTIIPIYREGKQTIFVDGNGKTIFTLPKGHHPQFTQPPFYPVFKHKLDVFHNGLTTIKTENDSIYWIDKSGNIIKEFGKKYSRFEPASSEYILGWKLTGSIFSRPTFIYMDKRGNNVFGNKKFWNASKFSDGYAAVQEKEDGNWNFINKQGEFDTYLIKYSPKTIKRIYNFKNGLSKIEILKENSKYDIGNYIFIDKQGREVINIKKLYPQKRIKDVSDYNEFIQIIFSSKSRNNDVVFIDKNGKEIIKLKGVSKCGNFKNELSLVQKDIFNRISGHNNKYLIDRNGKRFVLKLEDNYKIKSIKENGLLLHINIENDRHQVLDCLYKTFPLERKFSTKGEIIAYNRRYIFTVDENNYKLYDYNGKIIWEPDIEEIVYTSVNDALKNKNKAKRYIVNDSKDFNKGLFELKNLEELTLESLDLLRIPSEINQLKKLKKLNIINLSRIKQLPPEIWELNNLEILGLYKLDKLTNIPNNISTNNRLQIIEIAAIPNLKSIPLEFKNLNFLKELTIVDCGNKINGIEEIIEKLPNLNKFMFSGFNLEESFIQRMKKENPNLWIQKFY